MERSHRYPTVAARATANVASRSRPAAGRTNATTVPGSAARLNATAAVRNKRLMDRSFVRLVKPMKRVASSASHHTAPMPVNTAVSVEAVRQLDDVNTSTAPGSCNLLRDACLD